MSKPSDLLAGNSALTSQMNKGKGSTLAGIGLKVIHGGASL